MSEYINNNEARISRLFELCLQIVKGNRSKELIETYQTEIDSVEAYDIVVIVHRLVEEEISIEQLKSGITRFLNVFYKSISSRGQVKVDKNHFLGLMIQENIELNNRLEQIKPLFKKLNNEADSPSEEILNILLTKVEELKEIELHYQRKENILFPYIEQEFADYKCLSVMWSVQDDVRRNLKQVLEILKSKKIDFSILNRNMGDLFFGMRSLIFREEFLLFPVVLNVVNKDLWPEMNFLSEEIGYSYITVNKDEIEIKKDNRSEDLLEKNWDKKLLDFDTGLMTLKQTMMLLNNLPVDITLIDENDRVCYFSNPKDRFFTRSKAIIGRTVQNCHPPESVHMVTDLVNDFKENKKDKESFWIQMKGKFILIQYFALRDEDKKYCGCIEVSQDISEIKELKGEKRLME